MCWKINFKITISKNKLISNYLYNYVLKSWVWNVHRYCLHDDMLQIKNLIMHFAWRDMSCQYYLVFLLLLSSTPKKLYLVFLFSSSKSFSITRSICKSHYCFGDICSIKLSKKDTQTKLEKPFHRKPYVSKYFFKVFPPIFTFLKIQYIGTSLMK